MTVVEESVQDADFTYDSSTRTLTWQGEIPPAQLDYLIEESDIPLPYLDLAAYGAPNLCDPFFANAEPCKDAAVTFNLGINGYTAVLYGETISQLTVSSNGLLLGGDTTADGHNQWLPDAASPNFQLAGLWRDVDMGTVANTQRTPIWLPIIGSLLYVDPNSTGVTRLKPAPLLKNSYVNPSFNISNMGFMVSAIRCPINGGTASPIWARIWGPEKLKSSVKVCILARSLNVSCDSLRS